MAGEKKKKIKIGCFLVVWENRSCIVDPKWENQPKESQMFFFL